MGYTKFFIEDFEFRKELKNNSNTFEGWITINYKLIYSLFSLFREKDNRNVKYLENKYKVQLEFIHNSIKIINTDRGCYYKAINETIDEIIDIFEGDMNYLKSRNRLPPINIHKKNTPSPSTTTDMHKAKDVTITPREQNPVVFSSSQYEEGEIINPVPFSSDYEEQEKLKQILLQQTQLVPPPQQPPQLPPPQQPPQHNEQIFPGLIIVITKPTPKILAELFQNNINYSLIPEIFLHPSCLNTEQPQQPLPLPQ